MRRVFYLLLLLIAKPSFTIAQDNNYVPNEAIVMLKSHKIDLLTESLNSIGVNIDQQESLSSSMNIWLIHYTAQMSQDAVIAILRRSPFIQIAQSNHYVQPRINIPSDSIFSNQWDMNNTGQSGGAPNSDINAPEAWGITTGGLTAAGDTIVVAVIDGGFDLAHPDLSFWKNYAEIPNNLIDDDGNGYIDDYDGWNAVKTNGQITSSSHGTHISGTIGAKGNNGIGVAGINWNVKIMPVIGSSSTESVVIKAYNYVLTQRKLYNSSNGSSGAFIVSTNSSFGVNYGKPVNYPLWCAFYDSLGSAGILSAAATANLNIDVDVQGDIPTTCLSNYMIAVTNTTNTDNKYTNAAYGLTSIDIGAPGTNILSTTPGATYQTLTGTSMATPHIAGSIALMWAAACTKMVTDYKTSPGTLALIMKNYLLNSAEQISSLNAITVTNGRLNLFGALQQVEQYSCSIPTGNGFVSDNNKLFIHSVFPNPANGKAVIEYNSGGSAVITLSVYDLLGQKLFSTAKECNGGITRQLIDISGLPKGVYCVVIADENKVSNTQRLVTY